MYKGVGPPALVWGNTVLELPQPTKTSDDEYKPETVYHKNILKEIIPGEQQWRYDNKYEFAKLPQNTLDTLLAINNRTSVVKWIPHIDFPTIRYDVIIEVVPKNVKGLIHVDTATITVKGVFPIYKKPTIDNMITGVIPTRIGFIKGEDQ